MIRMLGIVENKPLGVDKSTYDEMVRHTEKLLGLGENQNRISRATLKALVKEEYVKIMDEAKKAAPKIEKKLEECRKEMMKELSVMTRETVGTTFEPTLEKRIQVGVVAEMIDVPLNELILYFMNEVKTSNDRKLVEYHLGHVYFYAC